MMPAFYCVFRRASPQAEWQRSAGPFSDRQTAFDYVWRQQWKGAENPGVTLRVFVYNNPTEDFPSYADMARSRELYEQWNEANR